MTVYGIIASKIPCRIRRVRHTSYSHTASNQSTIQVGCLSLCACLSVCQRLNDKKFIYVGHFHTHLQGTKRTYVQTIDKAHERTDSGLCTRTYSQPKHLHQLPTPPFIILFSRDPKNIHLLPSHVLSCSPLFTSLFFYSSPFTSVF